MAGRGTVRCLNVHNKLKEGILGKGKERLHALRAPCTAEQAFYHDNVGPTTLRPLSLKQILPWQIPPTPAIRHRFASQVESDLRKTPLHDLHVAKKAKFVPFGGYSMPLYYNDLSHVESHHWTREKASIFDVSHMYGASPSPLFSHSFGLMFAILGFSTSYRAPRQKRS